MSNIEIDYSKTYIATHSGIFYPFDMKPEDVNVEDIAHALSLLCRYNGHCKEFYSVAQHSVLVAQLVPEHLKLKALLHDASEAYISDVPKPIKRRLPDVEALENNISDTIFAAFDLSAELEPEIKRADLIMLLTESEQLHRNGWIILDEVQNKYGVKESPLDDLIINPLSPRESYELFMDTYSALTA